jgi:hypothetical protein
MDGGGLKGKTKLFTFFMKFIEDACRR